MHTKESLGITVFFGSVSLAYLVCGPLFVGATESFTLYLRVKIVERCFVPRS